MGIVDERERAGRDGSTVGWHGRVGALVSPGVLAWAALVAGSLLWDLSAASRAWADPPRARARHGEKGWWLQQGVYVSGYLLVLLGLLALQRAQGWSTLPLGLLVWLALLVFIGLVHRRRARRWVAPPR